MKQLVAVGNYYGAHIPFSPHFDSLLVLNKKEDMEKVEEGAVILFGGGEDISPFIYKEEKHPQNHGPSTLSHRDTIETIVFNTFKDKCFFLGICRGAQLLCALAGGKLIQHVSGHHGDHYMLTDKGNKVNVSSVHHQMMYPWEIPHELIGWSEEQLSNVYMGTNKGKEFSLPTNPQGIIEPEVVYFPAIKGLAIQYHPEFMSEDDPAVEYSINLLKEKYKNAFC